MKKRLLPILVFAILLAVYLSPRYPVFAITTNEASRPGAVPPKIIEKKLTAAERLLAAKEKQATKAAERKDKREDILEKLKAFKDQRKASIAARVNENLNKVNQKRTDIFASHLSKMKEIVSRLETLLSDVSGTDTSAAQEQLTNTKAMIKIAEASVSAQKAKQYALTVTNEKAVRLDAQSARNTLQKDLEAVHNAVINARRSLANTVGAIIKLAVSGEGTNNEQQ